MHHDVAMTNWEYSLLGSDGVGGWCLTQPDGSIQRNDTDTSFIVWLNELGRDGWEVAGWQPIGALLKRTSG